RSGCWPTSRRGCSTTTGPTCSSGCSGNGSPSPSPSRCPRGPAPCTPGSAVTDRANPDSRPQPHRPRPARGRRLARNELVAFLELFALCGFVVVQPMLAVVGGSPDFFIFHGVSGMEIALLVAFFAIVPPVALWGIGLLSRLAGPQVR